MSGPDRDLLEERLTGLAGWYLRKEAYDRAETALDRAEELKPGGFRRRLSLARLLVLQGAAAEAVFQLRAALELDPWDEDAHDLLAQLLGATNQHAEAAVALADALVCAGTVNPDAVADYESQIDAQLERAGRPGTRSELVAERRERLRALAVETERAAAEAGAAGETQADTLQLRVDSPPKPPTVLPSDGAALLHEAGLFPGLDAQDLEPLKDAVARLEVEAGQSVFSEGDPSDDIFVIESGRVAISRSTPFGPQALAHCEAGSVFGEMNFIDGRTRSADAVAETRARLLRVGHEALKEVFEAEPKLALAFLREFWRGLADKVREANELMKSFFEEGGAPPPDPEATAEPQASEGREEGVAEEEKTGLLTEQGLTGDELRRLASVAEARAFEVEQPVFREGDPGDSLYVVLGGEIRISKQIPGVGEEALAILERGGFFGEMSLIDGSPRSATAKAHAADTKVLRISKERLDELMDGGGTGAIELLSILCRLLSGRLREINDKIVQWKYMSGGF